MAHRFKMNRGKSERSFSRHAATTHKKNISSKPMRGGIRL